MTTNKSSLKFLVVIIAVVCITMSMKTKEKAPAARIGVVSYSKIMTSLPEAMAAAAELDTLQRQYEQGLKVKMEELQAFAQQYNAEVEGLTALEKADKLSQAEAMEAAIQGYKEKAQKAISSKQKELIEPLEIKVQTAIDALAKEQGYTHIFNSDGSGAPVLVYADTYTVLNEQILETLKNK